MTCVRDLRPAKPKRHVPLSGKTRDYVSGYELHPIWVCTIPAMSQQDWSVPKPSPPEETARDGMMNPKELRKAVAEVEGVELSPTYQLSLIHI